MKCNKCKMVINSNANYCWKCGNKINISSIKIINLVNIVLYIMGVIFFLVTLNLLLVNKAIISSISLFVSTCFIFPLTYEFVIKYFKYMNKVYLRLLIILFTFFMCILSIPKDNENIKKQNIDKIYNNYIENIDKKQEFNNEYKQEIEEKKVSENVEEINLSNINNKEQDMDGYSKEVYTNDYFDFVVDELKLILENKLNFRILSYRTRFEYYIIEIFVDGNVKEEEILEITQKLYKQLSKVKIKKSGILSSDDFIIDLDYKIKSTDIYNNPRYESISIYQIYTDKFNTQDVSQIITKLK